MFPYKIKKLDEKVQKELIQDFKGQYDGFCEVGPKKYIFPAIYEKHASSYYNMEVKEGDVWIVSYPRTGTTVTQELVWMVNNNFDFEKGKAALINRNLFLEFDTYFCDKFLDERLQMNSDSQSKIEQIHRIKIPGYIRAQNFSTPRQIKTHIPLSLLPPELINKAKVVYIARNPKDVAVSHYFHNKAYQFFDFSNDFNKYWDYFEKSQIRYCPFWEHVDEAWKLKDNPNLLFLFYEDLINDMSGVIRRVASFLNKPASPEQIDMLVDHLKIENFKKNVQINHEVKLEGIMNPDSEVIGRKKEGNEQFNSELNEKADKWINDHLENTDLRFPAIRK